MTKDWKELRKTIFGIIGSNEYLQPDMIIDHKGLMWRFNQDWLNQVTNNVIEALESNFVPKLEHQTKLALARANAMQTRTTTLGEVIMIVEKMKNTFDEYRDAKYSFPTLEAVTKEIKKMSTK